jgi:hypothetical protein
MQIEKSSLLEVVFGVAPSAPTSLKKILSIGPEQKNQTETLYYAHCAESNFLISCRHTINMFEYFISTRAAGCSEGTLPSAAAVAPIKFYGFITQSDRS